MDQITAGKSAFIKEQVNRLKGKVRLMIWGIAAFCAFFIKGICGFANTLVFNSILSFSGNNIAISPVELVLGYPSNIIMTCRGRRDLQAHIVLPLAGMVLAGSLAGSLFLKNTNPRVLKILFGLLIIITGLEHFFRGSMSAKREGRKGTSAASRAGVFVFGILSGICCGLFGAGAMLGAYLGKTVHNSSAFKADLCAVFAIENTFRIAVYTVTGILTFHSFIHALLLIPFMLAGLFCGIRASTFLKEEITVKLIMGLLIISGVVLIAANIG